MFKHEFLWLSKFRDHTQPRSTLSLSRATHTGLSQRCGSRDSRAHNRAHHLSLGRRRRPKKRKSHQEKAITQKGTKTYSPVTTRRGGAPLPSLHRLDGRFICRPLLDIRLAEGPANKNRLRLNKDPKAITNQNTRQKKSDAHLSQYAPGAHLQAAEAYSDNFWD